MKPNPSNNPEPLPNLAAITQSVTAAVNSHKRKIRFLTGAAFLLGFLAVAASVLIVSSYFVLYRPKEKEVLLQVTLAAERARANPAPAGGPGQADPGLPFDFPSIQATMTFFHSVIITLLAVAVGILGLGTLILLLVVVLSRRVTLQQINASLSQISRQLANLRPTEP
jgi:hypothetical protein